MIRLQHVQKGFRGSPQKFFHYLLTGTGRTSRFPAVQEWWGALIDLKVVVRRPQMAVEIPVQDEDRLHTVHQTLVPILEQALVQHREQLARNHARYLAYQESEPGESK